MEKRACDVLVLGAGPGGYVAAIRAAQLGKETIIVEEDTPGGTCLTVGCIPSKAMIHAAAEFHKLSDAADLAALGIKAGKPNLDLKKTQAWKLGVVKKLTGGVSVLLKNAGVSRIAGWGIMRDGKTCRVASSDGDIEISAKAVILATGSQAAALPGLAFGGSVISSTEALDLESLPASLAVVGGGYIGLELGSAFARFGSKVTIIEAMDRIMPLYDPDLVKPVQQSLAKLGVDVLTGTKARALGEDGTSLVVERAGGEQQTVPAEKILVTVGRKPRLEGWGRENLVIDLENGHVRIDERCQTGMAGVYAIGDLTGEPMLAHRAMAQAVVAAEVIAGQKRVFDPACIPAICFTDPEIVTAGLSKAEAEEAGHKVKVAKFPFAANGRALTMQAQDGFVRIAADEETGQVLGLAAVGSGVSELAAAFSLALEMGACLEDISATIHAHPTLGEAIHEASHLAQGHPLHVVL